MISTKAAKKMLMNKLWDLNPDWSPIQKSSPWPYVFGAIGVALVGGVAAVMIFSPRTRTRALGMAKDGYGKLSEKIEETGIPEKLGIHANGVANGVSKQGSNDFQTSGL